eukprot:342441-Alexandrium_andersonii.AAC.1
MPRVRKSGQLGKGLPNIVQVGNDSSAPSPLVPGALKQSHESRIAPGDHTSKPPQPGAHDASMDRGESIGVAHLP